MSSIKELFTKTYVNHLWSGSDSKSGIGSSLDYTIHFRKNLVSIINQYKIETIFDCSCGDWHWMKEIKEHLPNYVGNDIVDELIKNNKEKYQSDNIKFICNDALDVLKSYKDKSFDLIICRHTLEHLSNEYIIDIVKEIKRVSNFAIITSNYGINAELDSVDGIVSRIVNLDDTLYSEILGNPIKKYYDSIGEPTSEFETNCNFYEFK